MVDNMNCTCEEPSPFCWLATHNWLVTVWKILASCIQLACTCYQKLTCVLDFLGGNKQTNPILSFLFEWLAWLFSYCIWRSDLVLEITYTTAYCLMFWVQLNFICFSLHNLCIQTEMWLTVLIWKSLKITLFYKSCLELQCCHN
jgi:hypothetical protein